MKPETETESNGFGDLEIPGKETNANVSSGRWSPTKAITFFKKIF